MDALLLQQFVVSDAGLQQNLPGSHWRTDQEYWLPTREMLLVSTEHNGRR